MDRKIEIGKNTELVAEILAFVNSGTLLKVPDQAPSGEGVVTDLKVAKEFAWDKVYGEEEFTWSDLRSEKMSEIWGGVYGDEEKYSELDSKISNILDELSQAIKRQLDQVHEELLDDIVSDLKGCIYSRAILGGSNCFFEKIFFIYLRGGWPCGWNGDWARGNAIAYYIVPSK